MIKQISVMEPEFKKYGKVIGGYDLKEILQKMEEIFPDIALSTISSNFTNSIQWRFLFLKFCRILIINIGLF